MPRPRGSAGETTFIRHRIELVPKLWLLYLQTRSRIFQQKSVKDILTEVLASVTTKFELQGTYQPRLLHAVPRIGPGLRQ